MILFAFLFGFLLGTIVTMMIVQYLNKVKHNARVQFEQEQREKNSQKETP